MTSVVCWGVCWKLLHLSHLPIPNLFCHHQNIGFISALSSDLSPGSFPSFPRGLCLPSWLQRPGLYRQLRHPQLLKALLSMQALVFVLLPALLSPMSATSGVNRQHHLQALHLSFVLLCAVLSARLSVQLPAASPRPPLLLLRGGTAAPFAAHTAHPGGKHDNVLRPKILKVNLV